MPTVESRIINVFTELAPDTVNIQMDTPLIALGIDSLGVLEAVTMLEAEFNTTLPLDIEIGWVTVEDVAISLAKCMLVGTIGEVK